MTGNVIQSFLVSLGFGVDETSLSKFNKSIASAAIRVTALYATIQVAAAGIFKGVSSITDEFERFGYEARIIAPAINKALQLRNALLSAYRAAGINITKVVQESVKFNFSLAKTKFALDAIYKSVGSKFIPVLTKQLDIFRGKIYANLPKIQAMLEKFVKFILKAFEATTILGGRVFSILGRVWDFFEKLDKATNGWSTKILAAVAAWKLLNLAFLASPLGMILTGLVAILALYDDFKTFQEGGESLFDWSAAIPIFKAIADGASEFFGWLKQIWDVMTEITQAIMGLGSSNIFDSLIKSGEGFLSLIESIGSAIGKMLGVLLSAGTFGGSLSGIFGKDSAPGATRAPLLPQGGGTNQRVNQETNINIQGSPDANATGKAVAGEQGKVNFDLTRNLKSATQ